MEYEMSSDEKDIVERMDKVFGEDMGDLIYSIFARDMAEVKRIVEFFEKREQNDVKGD